MNEQSTKLAFRIRCFALRLHGSTLCAALAVRARTGARMRAYLRSCIANACYPRERGSMLCMPRNGHVLVRRAVPR